MTKQWSVKGIRSFDDKYPEEFEETVNLGEQSTKEDVKEHLNRMYPYAKVEVLNIKLKKVI